MKILIDGMGGDFAPEEIVKMRDELWEMILAYKDPERIEDIGQ